MVQHTLNSDDLRDIKPGALIIINPLKPMLLIRLDLDKLQNTNLVCLTSEGNFFVLSLRVLSRWIDSNIYDVKFYNLL